MVGTKKREGWTLDAGRRAQQVGAAPATKKSVRVRAGVAEAALKTGMKVGIEETELLATLQTIVVGASERNVVGVAVGQSQGGGFRFELGRWTERVQSQLDVNHQLMLGLVKQAKSVPQIPLTISCIKRTRVEAGGVGGRDLAIHVLRWRARAPARQENSRDMGRSDLMLAIEALPDAVRPFYEQMEQQVQVLNFIDRHLVSALQEVRALVANNVPIEVVSAVLARHESNAPFCRLMGQPVRPG